MASSMGEGASWQLTMRPFLLRVTRPAPAKTSRCFMTAGSDIANGCASSLIETPSPPASRATKARRVGSESAAKVRSSWAS